VQPLWRLVWAVIDAARLVWRIVAWRFSLNSHHYARRAKAYTDPFLVAVVTEAGAVPLRNWLLERGLRGADIKIPDDTWRDMVEAWSAEAAAEAQDRPEMEKLK
jgi:hypothetical protein